MNFQTIIEKLPYSEPFLFVGELTSVTDDGVEGTYTFDKSSYFYKGHFKNQPITPGVILTECMAQIGVACLGIYLKQKENNVESSSFALSSSEIEYYLPVLPGEKVRVVSEKIYFRFNKLKCKTKMYNSDDKLVAKGIISGMTKLNNRSLNT